MAFQARPTVYDGIPMRSRTEARFAAFLDRAGFEWAYGCDDPTPVAWLDPLAPRSR